MTMPTDNQRMARAENCVLRAYAALFSALRQADMSVDGAIKTAFVGTKMTIKQRIADRKYKKEQSRGHIDNSRTS